MAATTETYVPRLKERFDGEIRPALKDELEFLQKYLEIEQTRFARRHRRRQQLVAQLLHVGRGMHVEYDEVARDPFQTPVVMRSQ